MKTALRLTLTLLLCAVLCFCLVPGAWGDFFPLPGIIRGDFTLPANTTIIEDEAFSDCGWMKTVTIPAGVTRIGNNAFSGCINLDDVYYGGTQEQWGQITKGTGNDALTQATLHCTDSHPVVDSGIWGVLTWKLDDQGTLTISGNGEMDGFTYDSEEAWRKYKTDICSVVIDKDVTSIGDNAFRYCKGLTSVTIPGSMTSIGSGAFEGCRDLTSVTIPDSVTTIGNYAFKLSGLRSVTIGNSVTNIGDEAFDQCDRLWSVTIPDSVNIIGKYAFRLCQGLTSVTIGKSVTTIGGGAFDSCSDLRSMTIPKSVTTIGDAAFKLCGLTDIHVEEGNTAYCDINGVLFNKTVGSILLYPNRRRGEYTIPDSVTTIGNYAFYACDDLTSVTIPDSVTTIGDYAFHWCSELTSLTIGNSVTSIGGDAFSSCYGLTSVTIPDSVTSIGSSAFRYCGLTSVTVPGSVTRINGETFYACSGLTSATIEDGVNSIGVNAFAYCSAMTSVSIPDSMESIGDNAFYDCYMLSDVYYSGSEQQWDSLKANIGSSNSSFLRAKTHYYNTGGESYDYTDSGVLFSGLGWSVKWDVLYNEFGNTIKNAVLDIYIEGYNSSIGTIPLYSNLEDNTMMPWLASFQKTDFGKICIQGSAVNPLEIIPEQFSGYSNVKTVQLTSVSTLQAGAFSECTNLETVKYDGFLTHIGEGAFRNDTSLSVFKNNSQFFNLEIIDDEAFMNTGLPSFESNNALSSIGARAFQGVDLARAVIGNDAAIGDNAFTNHEGFVIICYRDSNAHQYAQREGIECLLMDMDIPISFCGYNARFSNSYFSDENPSTDSNRDLALLSGVLSWAIYEDEWRPSMRSVFSSLGIQSDDMYVSQTGKNQSYCYAIAKRKIFVDGEIANLLIICARGTKTWTERADDVCTQANSNFFGYNAYDTVFDFEKDKIMAGVNTFADDHPELKQMPLKVLITGHSLGGAAANLLGARFTYYSAEGSWWAPLLSKDDIYVYTFAALDSIQSDHCIADELENIHNIYNYHDTYGPHGWIWPHTAGNSGHGKFGHIDLFYTDVDHGAPYSIGDHLMDVYVDAIVNNKVKYENPFAEALLNDELVA